MALNPKLQPKFNPNAERLFLQALPPKEARQIAGSREKLERALKGGESLEEIYNEGKDKLYQWKTVGDILTVAGATTAGDVVSNAYDVAKAGGPHHGWMEKQRTLPTVKLLKSIRSLEKQIAQHQQWIDNPYLKVPTDIPAEEQDYYVTTKWPNDIARQRQHIDIIKGVIHERNINQA